MAAAGGADFAEKLRGVKEDILKDDDENTKERYGLIIIGPEGDFSPQERELALVKPNITSFTLSRNILRTDTAVISAISLVNFIHKDH